MDNFFVYLCVWFVITLAILGFTFMLDCIVNGDEFGAFFAWGISSLGFGICLTILLVQNGVFG